MMKLYKSGIKYSGFGPIGCEPQRLKVSSSIFKNKFYMHLTVVDTKKETRRIKKFSAFVVDDLKRFSCNLKRGGGPLRVERGNLVL